MDLQLLICNSQELNKCAVVPATVACDNLLDGDVGPRHEAHQTDDTDREVLDHHPPLHAFVMEGDDLKQRWNDEGQSAAAYRTHQRDHKVELWNQYGEGTWGETAKGQHV